MEDSCFDGHWAIWNKGQRPERSLNPLIASSNVVHLLAVSEHHLYGKHLIYIAEWGYSGTISTAVLYRYLYLTAAVHLG
jgi:hypothetical protein